MAHTVFRGARATVGAGGSILTRGQHHRRHRHRDAVSIPPDVRRETGHWSLVGSRLALPPLVHSQDPARDHLVHRVHDRRERREVEHPRHHAAEEGGHAFVRCDASERLQHAAVLHRVRGRLRHQTGLGHVHRRQDNGGNGATDAAEDKVGGGGVRRARDHAQQLPKGVPERVPGHVSEDGGAEAPVQAADTLAAHGARRLDAVRVQPRLHRLLEHLLRHADNRCCKGAGCAGQEVARGLVLDALREGLARVLERGELHRARWHGEGNLRHDAFDEDVEDAEVGRCTGTLARLCARAQRVEGVQHDRRGEPRGRSRKHALIEGELSGRRGRIGVLRVGRDGRKRRGW
mmetsp:Transcript_11606/g.30216  ORF Transcript_11606/g.30216 Transcript_11606/m.30216 type:complete len:347 (+) Transcript_11606:163-1203(+)